MTRHDLNDLRRDYRPNGRPMRVSPAVKVALEELGAQIEERRAVLQQEAASYEDAFQLHPLADALLIGTGALLTVGVLAGMLYCVLEWIGRAR